MQIKSVLIVGGGSSGWMTAAALVRQIPSLKITLMEAPGIPTIGVGESTIGHINSYMNAVGLKDEEWMPHCNATYKTSIKFTDFREAPGEKPDVFHYPFGICDITHKPNGPMEWFLLNAGDKDAWPPRSFAEFYHPHVVMADHNKMTNNENFEIRGFNFKYDTAYHMDAALFGQYLKNHVCIPEGVNHILDTMTGATKADDGSISGIITENSGTLTADLYIDCTGFRSLLLEGQMGSEFISFHDTLMNDRAIATIIPYIDTENEMTSATNCTALEAGWAWNIPLFNRIGTGYVYSSKFATEEEAEAQFRKYLASNRMDYHGEGAQERAEQAELKHIKIKHGTHKQGWIKNVVGIGLAMGFIEPLESTGLMLTHEGIMKIIDTLQQHDGFVTKFDIDTYNFAFHDQIVGFKDFISLHYTMSQRHDTPYWQYVTQELSYSPEMNDWVPRLRNAYMDLSTRILTNHAYDFNMGGVMYIAAGQNYNPVNKRYLQDDNDRYGMRNQWSAEESTKNWVEYRDNVLLPTIEKLPTHYEYLKKHIHIKNEEQ
jgi:tryptophan halogenase